MRLTKKKALDISIELWEWLAETGSGDKAAWPSWTKYGDMAWDCPLCEYAFHLACEKCPLRLGERGCVSLTSYGDWTNAKTKAARKKYAGLFLEQLKEIREAIK